MSESENLRFYEDNFYKREALTNDDLCKLVIITKKIGKHDKFLEAFKSLQARELENDQQRAKYHYIEGIIENVNGNYKSSYEKMNKAAALSTETDDIHWYSKNMMAVYYSIIGRNFLALDMFSEVSESKLAPADAVTSAISNLVNIYIDLGHMSPIRSIYHRAINRTQFRFDLINRFMDIDISYVCDIISPENEDTNRSLMTVENSLYIIGTLLLSGDFGNIRILKKSWLMDNYLEKYSNTRFSDWLYVALGMKNPDEVREQSPTAPWKVVLFELWCEALYRLSSGDKEGSLKLLNELGDHCNRYNCSPCYIIRLHDNRFVPDVPMALKVKELVGLSSTTRASLHKIEISDGILNYYYKDKEVSSLSLKKSPKSLSFIKVLSGIKSKSFKKSYVHEQTSLEEYDLTIHDTRMHKLLTRLKQKLEKADIPEFCTLPGDNTIKLEMDIVINK